MKVENNAVAAGRSGEDSSNLVSVRDKALLSCVKLFDLSLERTFANHYLYRFCLPLRLVPSQQVPGAARDRRSQPAKVLSSISERQTVDICGDMFSESVNHREHARPLNQGCTSLERCTDLLAQHEMSLIPRVATAARKLHQAKADDSIRLQSQHYGRVPGKEHGPPFTQRPAAPHQWFVREKVPDQEQQ